MCGHPAIPVQVLVRALLQLSQLLSDLLLARLRKAESRRITVRLFVLSEMIEAGEAITSSLRGGGIDFSRYRRTSARERFRLYKASP
jgi:hypothetical protein